MGIFDNLFLSVQEKKVREIINNKPQTLMHTSSIFPDKVHVLRPTYNKTLNSNAVFATDNKKLALLYALQPFFSFRFGKNKEEIGVILIGSDHDLLRLDSKIAYTYFLDSNNFEPFVEKDGFFQHEWFSKTEVSIRKDIPPAKVVFNDILRSGIQVFWVNNMQTLSEMDQEMLDNNILTGEKKLEYLMEQTNWKPDKVMYINRFRNICPVKQVDGGYIIEYKKQINIINR